MATTTENRPRPVTGAESEFDHASRATPRPEIRVNQSNQGSNSSIPYLILALVLIVGGYFLYTNYWNPTSMVPAATQSSTTLPKSEVIVPAPVTPPAVTTVTPPVDAPATTPAAPATPPATTTTP